MALVVAAGAVSKAAYADPLGDLGNTVTGLLNSSDESSNAETQADDAFDEYTVQTVSPSGTTINLFDYWTESQDGYDGSREDSNNGINKDHQLHFTRDSDLRLNLWDSNSKGPLYDVVARNLIDGYPQLNADEQKLGTDHTESLAYLFNSTEFDGKEANLNVTGLLQQVDGYYQYDSHENFASYDADVNSFKVYAQPAVDRSGTSPYGQFFPFNSADEVFDINGGDLVAKNIDSQNSTINHYFGLSMTSRFVQPTGGKTNTGANMVFEFTGDDDVWVFIDDVLVGDVGGIHDASSVSIDFVTGDVSVRCANDANAARDWKLDELFMAAGKSIDSFNGHTFADGTEHTLKFFYLERGNVDSNMKLKFNLVTVPNSDIVKIDQDGEPIENAEFALYEANESFVAQGDAIASGTTDASGNLLLTSVDDGTIINFDELYKEAGSPGTMYYLLEETVVPEGYRTGLSNTDDSMHLVYQYSETAGSGVLTDAGGTSKESYIWQNGAFAGSKETLTAPGTVYGIDPDDGFAANTGNVIKYENGGTLFAVVLKRTGEGLDDQNSWQAMSGEPISGYTLETAGGIAGAISAAQKDAHPFLLNSSGQYQVELTDLPGDITKYYFMLDADEKSQAEYTVAVYYTKGSLKDATTENTERVYSDDFERQFSARLYIPNIQNRLFVQKDDGAGNYLDGAEFSLYKEDQVDDNGQLIENAQAYDTVWTQEHLDEPSLDGAAAFPNNNPLVEGTYYLKETTAPEGYELNDTLIKVVVDDTGVHAYAGDEGVDDGVSTFAGVGKLVKSMAQFGAHDNLDNTLTWIAGTRQMGSVNDEGVLKWADTVGDVLHLEYGAGGAGALEYGIVDNDGSDGSVEYPIETESGWLRVGVTQDDKPVTDNAVYTKLGDRNLNALLSGITGVRVTDEPVSSLEVTKTVEMTEGLNGNPDAEFTFQFDLDYAGDKTYKARVVDANGQIVGEEHTLSTDSRTIAIKADQSIRVSGLAEGSDYTVTEITDDMPTGYTLTKRTVAGAEYEPDSEGNAITGKIEALAAGGAVNPNNKLGFVNEYNATGTLPISGTKDISSTNSPWNGGKAGFEFTIDAAADDEATIEAVASGTVTLPDSATVESAEDGTFTFGNITFTKPGTYKFQVTEVVPDPSEPGMLYDTKARIVTVNVAEENTSNGNGKLVATIGSIAYVNGGDASLNFINTYTTQNATSADIAVTKVVTGHDALSAFNFTMKADENTQKLIDAGGYIVNGTSELKATTGTGITPSVSGTANFGTLEFIKAGTYVFTITEDEAQATWPAGWTYDQHTCTVTITVTDNQDDDNAQLVASVAYSTEDGGSIFTNSFATKTTYGDEGGLNVTKTLNGRTLLEGEFSFTIKGADDASTAKLTDESDKSFSNSAPGNQGIATMQKLSALSFDQTDIGKTYTYVVAESIPDGAVEKDGVFAKDGITFDTKPVTVAIKVLEKNGDIYTETTVTKDGKELGKYSSADGKTAAVAPFVNTYSAGDLDAQIDVPFTKSFNGWNTIDAFDNKSFDFTITPKDGAPEPANDTVTVKKPDTGSDATFSFGTITFQASDLGDATSKDFVYEVKEVTPADTDPNTPDIQNGGITYAGHTATVVVTVEDTGTGTLVASVKSATGLKFTNTYSSSFDYVDAGGLKITKTLNGRDMTDGQFGFTVTPQDKDSADKLGLTEGENEFFAPAAKDGEPATINLLDGKDVTFTQDDAGKTYVYKINETTVGGAGYTNDTAERTVTISVVDNGDATLTVTTTVEIAGEPEEKKQTFTYTTGGTDEAAAVVPFVNEYSTIDGGDTSVVLNATKTLTGRDLVDEEFAFQVLDGNKTVIATGTNDADGKVTFDKAINYTVESLKAAVQNGTASVGSVDGKRTWTIPYTVSEVTDGLDDKGITVVAGSFQVGVAVTDNDDGTLTSKVFYPDGADGLTFENAYGAQSSVKLNINGTKNYDKSDLPNAPEIAGMFTFTLETKDGGPLPQKDGEEVATATNDAAGNINFGQIEYTMANVFGNTDGVKTDDDGNRYKTFTYTVTESAGSVPGVSIDKTTKTFTVTITDNGDGSLSYKTDGDFSFAFTNTYSVDSIDSNVTDQISITKKLDGREMVAGEFDFELVEMVDGTETVVATGTNDAEGAVTFEAIEYTTPGEHDYLVREVAGDKGGVTYDARTFRIHTSVVDNGDGTLSATHVAVSRDAISFVNTYEADPITVNLGAAKLLNNAKPGDARFTFQVLNKDGKVEAEAQNNEEGTIQFPELSFDTAGEYEYTIVEANDGQEGVTYDGSEHKIKITVTDNKEGSLVADIEGMDELILFSNTYTEPEGPSEPGGSEPPALPDTSDNLGPLVIGLGALAVIACAGLVIGAVKMRRKSGAHRSR